MAGSERKNGTSKHEKVISVLLSQSSIKDAAIKARVGESTIRRWLREDEEFKSSYRTARRQVVEHAVTRLQRACEKAVRTLEQVMDNSGAPASARVTSARTCLEMAIAGVERDDILA